MLRELAHAFAACFARRIALGKPARQLGPLLRHVPAILGPARLRPRRADRPRAHAGRVRGADGRRVPRGAAGAAGRRRALAEPRGLLRDGRGQGRRRVGDRTTSSHEYLFHLAKSERYFYDAKAIAEPAILDGRPPRTDRATAEQKRAPTALVNGIRARDDKQRGHGRRHAGFNERWDAMERAEQCGGLRNRRSVWTISPANFDGAHFAVMPEALAEPCILAGSRPGDVVLDPFAGSGTTAVVALRLGRSFLGVELNPEYAQMAQRRIVGDAPLFNQAKVR
jgi:hypothetical protein